MNNEHVYLYVPKKGCGESSIDQQKQGYIIQIIVQMHLLN